MKLITTEQVDNYIKANTKPYEFFASPKHLRTRLDFYRESRGISYPRLLKLARKMLNEMGVNRRIRDITDLTDEEIRDLMERLIHGYR